MSHWCPSLVVIHAHAHLIYFLVSLASAHGSLPQVEAALDLTLTCIRWVLVCHSLNHCEPFPFHACWLMYSGNAPTTGPVYLKTVVRFLYISTPPFPASTVIYGGRSHMRSLHTTASTFFPLMLRP
ncbi:hypothetical protein BDR03DRAFT_544584 [Suillus americanus]|nr:hypothetical protein BDR03DRAFT_544584 [Suillus americanus]